MIDDDQDGIIQTPGLDDYARSAPPGDALDTIAELVRRLLACRTVVIRLAGAAASDADALADPLAANDAGYEFYAGIPLRTASGRNLGTIAALDEAPRRLTKTDLDTLKLAAALAVEVIELREALGGAIAIASRVAR